MGRLNFAGFPFPYNPQTYESIQEKDIAVKSLVSGKSSVQLIAVKPRIIKGEGAFVGNYADNFRKNMKVLFNRKESGKLILPYDEEIQAFFIKLNMTGDGKTGLLHYQFTFLEDCQNEVN